MHQQVAAHQGLRAVMGEPE